MKTSKMLHREHIDILWRIRLQHSDGRVWFTNGFSIEGGLIACTSTFIPVFDGWIMGRRMKEYGFKRYLKVVDYSTESRGVLLLEELGLGGNSNGSFGVLASNTDIMRGDKLSVTTYLPGMQGSFFDVQALSDCITSSIVSPGDNDVTCDMFNPTRDLFTTNLVIGEVFNQLVKKSLLGRLLGSIPIFTIHKFPPTIRGGGGVVTNRDGSIVGILLSAIEPNLGVVIHVSCIMDCVKKYKDENNIKGKKHEEGKVREEKSSEKQLKPKKKWNDTRDKGKKGTSSGVTPAGEKKRLSRQMTKQYDRSGVEKSWYAWWEKSCFFVVGSSSSKPPLLIVLPPPNVAGALRIGYALSLAIQGAGLDKSSLSKSFLENQLDRNSGKVVVKPTKAGSSIGVTVAYGVTDTLEKTKEIITEGIDDKIIVELVLEGGSEFTAIVLDEGYGFDCQIVVLLPTEVELQFHGSTDLAEKDAIFNYDQKCLPKQQITYHTPPRFPFSVIQTIREGGSFLFKQLGLRDFARIDDNKFGRTESGSILYTDINLISGMGQTSFLFQQASKLEVIPCLLAPAAFDDNKSDARSRTVWSLPYSVVLRHTTEEVLDACIEAMEPNRAAFTSRLRRQVMDDIIYGLKQHNWFKGFDISNEPPVEFALENGIQKAKEVDATVFIAGPGVMASQTCMDKVATSLAINHLADSGVLTIRKDVRSKEDVLNLPIANIWQGVTSKLRCETLCNKPARDGCSTGVARLCCSEDLVVYVNALTDCLLRIPPNSFSRAHGMIEMSNPPRESIIFEPFIETGDIIFSSKSNDDKGRDLIWNGKSRWVEITVGVVGKHGSMQSLTPSITVKESGDIFSLEEKFQEGTSIIPTPPPISIVSNDALANCKKHIELIANTLQLEGFSRIDAFVNVDTGEVLIEVNTGPGMTPSTVLIRQALAEQPPVY